MLNGTLREDGVVSSLLDLIDQVVHSILPSFLFLSSKIIHTPCPAAPVHELRRHRPPLLAVSGQTQRHEQHSLHKVSLKLRCFPVPGIDFNIYGVKLFCRFRCGGAGHTTGDCMVS